MTRPLPLLTPANRHFWRGGADGELLIARCGDCGYWIHPPGPTCPRCLSEAVAPTAASGRATVVTWTVNHQPWSPGEAVPFALAIVELAEQEHLRLTTNLVNCDLDEIVIGLPVRVTFLDEGDVFVPVFEPVGD